MSPNSTAVTAGAEQGYRCFSALGSFENTAEIKALVTPNKYGWVYIISQEPYMIYELLLCTLYISTMHPPRGKKLSRVLIKQLLTEIVLFQNRVSCAVVIVLNLVYSICGNT